MLNAFVFIISLYLFFFFTQILWEKNFDYMQLHAKVEAFAQEKQNPIGPTEKKKGDAL